jgi:N-acetyl-gamma-glutamyl-phosphate reductase
MHTIYIDGLIGTTGLQIHERLLKFSNLKILEIPSDLRKDPIARSHYLNNADISILCLPDQAAVDAVNLINSDKIRIIDASSAHRTKRGWVYGFPELNPSQAEKISKAKRLAVPGCHATGFISIMYPLVTNNLIDKNYTVNCFSLTGYSGGGRAMINEYESFSRPHIMAPKMYALNGKHKHIKEMMQISGLNNPPIFNPIVCDYYQGMAVTIGFSVSDLHDINHASELQAFYSKIYAPFSSKVHVAEYEEMGSTNGSLFANSFAGRDDMILYINGNSDNITVTAVYDNLGKGAAGAALQCLELMLGCK